jgi:peptidoglycan pentaglycine glycine transferase (the first glycine)
MDGKATYTPPAMSRRTLLQDTLSPDEWDAFVAGPPAGHLLQGSHWAALKERFGWQVARVALAGADHIAAGAQLLFRPLPWGQTLAYVPKGPLLDWENEEQVRALLAAIRPTARAHRAVALKIEPHLTDRPQLAARLASYGFRPGHPIQPRSTIVVDLDAEPEEILARMKPKWRYNVRLAQRKGLVVRQGAEADLPAFQRLMDETARRDGFAVHQASYYAAAYRLFVPAQEAVWLLAELEGQLLAAIVVFAFARQAWYFWGASSNDQRQLMPNHALQWAAMLWARERGCRSYDLWGIPDEVGASPADYEDSDRWGTGGLWGVYRFKQGFGGRVERSAGAWDLVYSPVGYRLYRAAVELRRQMA